VLVAVGDFVRTHALNLSLERVCHRLDNTCICCIELFDEAQDLREAVDIHRHLGFCDRKPRKMSDVLDVFTGKTH
jgi:hypothetical protein